MELRWAILEEVLRDDLAFEVSEEEAKISLDVLVPDKKFRSNARSTPRSCGKETRDRLRAMVRSLDVVSKDRTSSTTFEESRNHSARTSACFDRRTDEGTSGVRQLQREETKVGETDWQFLGERGRDENETERNSEPPMLKCNKKRVRDDEE